MDPGGSENCLVGAGLLVGSFGLRTKVVRTGVGRSLTSACGGISDGADIGGPDGLFVCFRVGSTDDAGAGSRDIVGAFVSVAK